MTSRTTRPAGDAANETAEACGGCGREREIREVIDGDRLCQACCDRWAREEGAYERYLREEEAAMREQLDAEDAERDAA